MNTTFDFEMMLKAIEVSLKGRVTAPPNPWVGCVIVSKGQIVAEGFHRAAGEPHAERRALDQAQGLARNSTVYVSLEPCSHYGKTPPCTQALIDAKVAKVVIGSQDPDSRVRGQGIKKLREAGIEVVTDVAKTYVVESLKPYLHHRSTGRPYCLAKAAISVDGRIAAEDKTSQWITGPEAQKDSHQLRAESQAIIIGARTAIEDKPSLTVRDIPIFPIHPPLRVVLDAKGHFTTTGPLFDTNQAPTLIITTKLCPSIIMQVWEKHGVEIAVVSPAQNQFGVDLQETMDLLGSKNIIQVLVEGGGTLLASFLESRLIQHLCLYVGPRILGSAGIPLFNSSYIKTLGEAPQLNLLGSKVCGNSVRIDYSFNPQLESEPLAG